MAPNKCLVIDELEMITSGGQKKKRPKQTSQKTSWEKKRGSLGRNQAQVSAGYPTR